MILNIDRRYTTSVAKLTARTAAMGMAAFMKTEPREETVSLKDASHYGK